MMYGGSPLSNDLMQKAFPEFMKPITLVPRDEWGAQPSREMETLPHPIKSVVFAYNTDEPLCKNEEACVQTVQRLQKKHMDMGLSDIYYNFVIGGDRRVYEGRGWNFRHSKSANFPKRYETPLVIGIIGDAKGGEEWRPPYELVAPGMHLVKNGVKEDKVIVYHSIFEDHNKIVACEMPGC